MNVQIKVSGIQQLQQNLQGASKALSGQQLGQVALAGAQTVERFAKANIRNRGLVDTGNLLNSVNSRVISTSNTRAVAACGTDVPYAAIHEFGGVITPVKAKMLHFQINGQDVFAKAVHMPARPYLRPAVDEHHADIERAMAATVKRLLK